MKTNQVNKTALITGASRGLGLALARQLAKEGWQLIINGRNAQALKTAAEELSLLTSVIAISGNVIDEIHLLQFIDAAEKTNGIDLVINNASTLGASPQPKLLEYPIEAIHTIFHTNVIAPLSLLQKVHKHLKTNAKIINTSSDAAQAAYEGWGGYGSSKAALDHLTAILAKEYPQYGIYSIDPGDMRTQMHQEAFPNEDISDRPLPEESVPGFMAIINGDLDSGRYEARKIAIHTT